jgi:hypothetical protein
MDAVGAVDGMRLVFAPDSTSVALVYKHGVWLVALDGRDTAHALPLSPAVAAPR